MLKETFKAAGEVQYAEIKKDNDNKSRGFGIVRFTHPDEARRAVSILIIANHKFITPKSGSVSLPALHDYPLLSLITLSLSALCLPPTPCIP